MRPLRVVLATETYFPAVGAAATTPTTVVALADRLAAAGHQVLVVAPGAGRTSHRGVRVHRVSMLDRVGRQVREGLEAFVPDVVLACSPGTVGRKCLKHARARRLPTLVVETSPLLDVSIDHWRRKVAARADEVVVTTAWMQERVAELGVDAGLWRPGVDTEAFTPRLRDDWLHASWSRRDSRTGPRLVVGYVGALHQRHGVRRLAGLAAMSGVRPVVIGDGPERAWLEARLPEAKLLGTLAPADLGVALPSLDVLVHPGEHETCAHVLREAAASGVPVVAARAGGAREAVAHGETGLLVRTGDRDGLVGAVEAMVRDPHRARLGERGREVAAARSWTSATEELVESRLRPLIGQAWTLPGHAGT